MIARVRAPEVFASLRQGVAHVEGGRIPVLQPLDRWLADDDKLQLEQLREHLPSWVDSALYHLAQQYGEIPQDIVTRFQTVARAVTGRLTPRPTHRRTIFGCDGSAS